MKMPKMAREQFHSLILEHAEEHGLASVVEEFAAVLKMLSRQIDDDERETPAEGDGRYHQPPREPPTIVERKCFKCGRTVYADPEERTPTCGGGCN